MAGDWIKIECATPNKPEVFEIAELIGVDPDEALGKLIRVWVWADQQTIDGNAASVTKALLNRVTGCPKFTDAMIQVGWLEEFGGRVTFTNFGRHNGKTAKTRALGRKRTDNHRSGNGSVTPDVKICNAASVTDALPEKRREEKSIKEREKAEIPVHPKEILIPANVASEQCKAQMEYMFRVMNHRRAGRGESNVDDFGMQANWDIAGKIGPERLHEVIAMAISREWKALVVPDGIVDKKSNRKSGGFTDDENAEWVRITAACRIPGDAGNKARAQFDDITKQIMNSIGGSEAVRKTNPGDFNDNELKTRFFSTKRVRVKLEESTA